MTIELVVEETLERKLADVWVPQVDVRAVRRTGRGRLWTRVGGTLTAVVTVVASVSALVWGTGGAPDPPTVPVTVRPIYFGDGLRAFYDPGTTLVHLGAQTFAMDDVRYLDTSATVTPWGLVYFGPDQSMRLLPNDGRARKMASGPARPDSFSPNLKYDAGVGTVSWLTMGNGRVSLSVYEFGAQIRLIGSYPVPCSGAECQTLSVAGADQGLVFVRGSDGTRVIDPVAGPNAVWTDVTDDWVADVRNRVILTSGSAAPTLPPALAEAGWRSVAAQGARSVLTLDGQHELSGTTTLRPTAEGGVPVTLALPEGTGDLSVNLDSDGSVMVSRSEAGAQVLWDCQLGGVCTELGRLSTEAGEPALIGADS